ncbi:MULTISPECIES: hypothetical protein [unclassified Pseudomonas]|uniref:hypothetical protein n=1 Tax=unclassified Pseudomonas TaxID=196821 RepID=UPI00117A0645|nr:MULTISPECIES: hypothetical protein [unclassified Pseudomonas]
MYTTYITYKGIVYTATYSVGDGMVKVRTALYGEASTQISNTPVEWLARNLLQSLITDADSKGRL